MAPGNAQPPQPKEPQQSGKGPEDPNLWVLASAGLELAAGVGVFALVGWWLDGKWGTSPWLVLIGAGLGLGGGLYNLWKQARRYM